MLARPGRLRGNQLNAELVREPDCDLVLHGKQVARVAAKALSPKMLVGFGGDQLGVDADLVARPSHAAFQYIAHSQLAPDLLCIDVLVPVRECSIARDD